VRAATARAEVRREKVLMRAFRGGAGQLKVQSNRVVSACWGFGLVGC